MGIQFAYVIRWSTQISLTLKNFHLSNAHAKFLRSFSDIVLENIPLNFKKRISKRIPLSCKKFLKKSKHKN